LWFGENHERNTTCLRFSRSNISRINKNIMHPCDIELFKYIIYNIHRELPSMCSALRTIIFSFIKEVVHVLIFGIFKYIVCLKHCFHLFMPHEEERPAEIQSVYFQKREPNGFSFYLMIRPRVFNKWTKLRGTAIGHETRKFSVKVRRRVGVFGTGIMPFTQFNNNNY